MTTAPILDHLTALADGTRNRILLLLERQELTVSELCGVMQLPQSTVSRHLKALADSGWVASRAEGTSNVYTMRRDDLDAGARRLWSLVREQTGPTAAARRAGQGPCVVRRRRAKTDRGDRTQGEHLTWPLLLNERIRSMRPAPPGASRTK